MKRFALGVITGMLIAPAAALAAGNEIGSNLASLLREIAGPLYTGLVAIVALPFLLNRRFQELAVFIVVALLVGWLVFAPGQIADAARATAQQVLP